MGIAIKSTFCPTQINSKVFHSFEHTIVKLPCANNKYVILISIYRLLFIPVSVFHAEFTEFLEMYAVLHDAFIIAGDINIHVETGSTKFKELIYLFNLKQHVIGPTHILGHTIDIVITRNDLNIENIVITKYDLSHHFMIDFVFHAQAKEIFSKSLTYRNVKGVNSEMFCNEVTTGLSMLPYTTSMADKVSNYNEVMSDVVNKHAPVKTKTIKVVPQAPWFDAEYASLRRQRRKAEKKYRQTSQIDDKEEYITLRRQTTALSKTKKESYISDKLKSDKSSKNLYTIVNNLLDNNNESLLPTSQSNYMLAENFSEYFSEKVKKIRASIKSFSPVTESKGSPPNVTLLFDFEPATADELKQIILSYGIKCSSEDPVPVFLLEENLDVFIPYWLDIVNLSLEVGSMECLKNAVIQPLIKDLSPLVDKENMKNYRPVSNLLFLSKLIERIVDIRLQQHISRNNLHSDNQFGYKKYHSTESLLLKIVDNLLLSCDVNMPSVVLLLDLSAAFDTVDHGKLLEVLYNDIGIRGTVYNWCKSFLTNRTFKVKIENSYSNEMWLPYGVAQGSVLGPRFFNIYTKSLYKYVEPTRFKIEGFADDHQLIKRFLPSLQSHALGDNIQYCLNMISQWMNDHFLCLNQDKTKILVIAPPCVKKEIIIGGMFLDDHCIRFVDSAKNLGIILDSELSFNHQINKVVKSCFNTLRKLSSIRHFLSSEHLKSLVCSYIFSQIDYCNSLYFGINLQSIKKLQHVQNCAARLISKKRLISLDETFLEFHWLKVRERIVFKLMLLVHKCLYFKAPESLRNLLSYSDSERSMKLRETKVRTRYGDRAFSHAGPKLWNMLPHYIRSQDETNSFKKMLKSFLITMGDDFHSKINIH